MKRLLSLMLIAVIIMGSFVSIGFGESKKVNKVVFRGLTATKAQYTALGGIRFYNGEELIKSGEVVSDTQTSGETEFFFVKVDHTYNRSDKAYSIVKTLKQNVSQTGGVGVSYWLSENDNQTITIDFKQPTELTKLEFVPRPDSSYGNRQVDNIFYIDCYYTDGTMNTYDVTPISENNTVQTVQLANNEPINPSLNVISSTTSLKAGDTIDINLVLKDAKDIYAEDFTLNFDTNAFELIDSKISDEVSNKLYYSNSTEGNVRYVVGSNGKSYGINDEKSLVTVTLKAKNFNGETTVDFKNGLIADSAGNEFTVLNNGLKFNIEGALKDVNNTGTFTLGDLSIACYLLDSDSSTWGSFTPDVDNSGAVDTLDLSKIVEEILKN